MQLTTQGINQDLEKFSFSANSAKAFPENGCHQNQWFSQHKPLPLTLPLLFRIFPISQDFRQSIGQGTAYLMVQTFFSDSGMNPSLPRCPQAWQDACSVSIFSRAICHMLTCSQSGSWEKHRSFSPGPSDTCQREHASFCSDDGHLSPGLFSCCCTSCASENEWVSLPKAKDPLIFVILPHLLTDKEKLQLSN